MYSYMNRNWLETVLFGGESIRVGFIVRWFMALAVGCSVAHAENQKSIECEAPHAVLGQHLGNAFDCCQRADRKKVTMNENETIAKLNPKLGKILARLLRAQEGLLAEERRQGNESGRKPIGMRPSEAVSARETDERIGVKKVGAVGLAQV